MSNNTEWIFGERSAPSMGRAKSQETCSAAHMHCMMQPTPRPCPRRIDMIPRPVACSVHCVARDASRQDTTTPRANPRLHLGPALL
jgi:hypothetical protein